MKCQACGYEVDARAKFCSECGARLAAAGRSAPDPRSYTPAHLTGKILASRAALEGERKQVTVLFADVKGSLELAEQVDPEAWHAILDRFFAILADGIHGFEGTINQYTGDGVMALFGAPIAHEDHAQRACHAALALRAELRRYADALRVAHGLNFSVRMGLNSGEVVVGRIGDDLRMDYTAQGHTVGLAARMEQLAEPGTVLLTEHTAALARGYFALRDLGTARIKGAREPLGVFELVDVGPMRTRLERSRSRGFSRFVGRAAELAELNDHLDEAARGSGRTVAVVGEAGLGKSRLAAELIGQCRERGAAVYEAHCPSHGRGVPFLPILALLRAYFAIGARDGAAAAREKIAGRLLVSDDRLRDALPVLFEFLGVGDPLQAAPRMDPEARRRQLFALVRRIAEPRRLGETVLIAIDDLHWLDPASEAFVAELVDAAAGTSTMLLVNFRPEYRADWLQNSSVRRIELAPLAAGAADAMLDELLGDDPSLGELRALIRSRTAGNPFFIEEVVRTLYAEGALERDGAATRLRRAISDIRIPDTVQAVLAARIDRLTEDQKSLLQTAAVIGKEFEETELVRVVSGLGERYEPSAERALVDAGLIHEDRARAGGSRLAFRHPLIQEVAYRSQLAVRRERVHRAVAEALQELHAERLGEAAALIAHHWQNAACALEAARWSRRAAEWAGISDMAEAARHWRRVHELVRDIAESEESLELEVWAGIRLLGIGWRSGMSADEAAALFAEGVELTRRIGQPRPESGFFHTYGMVRGMGGEVMEALDLVREGSRIAEGTGDPGLRIASRVALVQAQVMAGQLRAALASADEGIVIGGGDLALGESGTGFSPFLYLLVMRGHIRAELGRLDEADRDLSSALSQAGERGEVELLGWSHEFCSYAALHRGECATAAEHARRAFEIAEKIGSPLSRASANYALGSALIATGEWRAAVTALEESIRIMDESRTGLHWRSRVLGCLAEALAHGDDIERARAVAADAERASLSGGDSSFECLPSLAVARARLLTDGPDARGAIEKLLARAADLIAATGCAAYVPFVHEQRAALARACGDEDAARRELATARTRFEALGARAHAARVAQLEQTPDRETR